MASGSFHSNTGVNLNLYCKWSSTTNVAGNYSTVTMRTYLEHYSLYVGARSDTYVKCNGENYTYNAPAISYGGSSKITTTLLSSKTFTVYHNSDGTKSITLKAGWRFSGTYSGVSIGWITCSKTVTLDNIPRASSISSVTSSVTVDGSNSVTVNISRNSTAFTHKVKFAFGSYSQEYTGVATSKSYAPPMTWLNAIPNATSGTATVTVTTYNGSTQIGSAVSKNFTVNVPSSVVPTLGTFSATIVNNTVPSSWGIYVQDKSQCRLQISNASGAYSSTIKAYSIKQGSTTLSTSSSVTTPVLAVTGVITYTATITDSRGRTASKTVSIQVYAYVPPSVTSALSQRCLQNGTLNDNGTYIKATGKFSFASCDQKNSATAKVYFKKPEDASWSTGVAFSSNVPVVIAGSASIDSSYQVMYEVTDAFTTVQFIGMLSTAFTTMDFKKGGKGVAIGKVSEYDNLFDVGMPSKFHEGLVLVDEHGTEYDVLQILKNLLN